MTQAQQHNGNGHGMDFDLLAFQHCQEWIRAALEATTVRTTTLGDVFAMIQQHKAQLHPFPRCAFVTMLEEHPAVGLKSVSCWAGGGNMAEMLEVTPTIEAWARSQQCTHAFISGRQGWKRALASQGYVVDRIILVKDLRNAPPD